MSRNLETRIERLETLAHDPLTDFFYDLTVRFAASQNMPAPQKQRSVGDALKQLSSYLPN
ncbi:hypothetical protein SAMN05216326_12933 [Nitrosomonas marina]|uniref:Uncharacterized protein n=1 Tax=Nitrosomonas marina TaxID=917 RepID=A0A1I0EPB4_9PROT|nr:hypothetical protein [Nitrosomonas marina]SET47180.1 hypothetical protein SAMN05216326_12933 [Nitrosomonas marina]